MFKVIRSNYPSTDPCDAKDPNGQPLFRNQCAIRVGHALKKSGVSFVSFPKQRKCWVHPTQDHILAAKELADWLQKKVVPFIPTTEDVTGENWRDNVVPGLWSDFRRSKRARFFPIR
jgi:hypothetical protein